LVLFLICPPRTRPSRIITLHPCPRRCALRLPVVRGATLTYHTGTAPHAPRSSANSVMGMGPVAATKLTPEQATQRDELMMSHHLNLAAVYIKVRLLLCDRSLSFNCTSSNLPVSLGLPLRLFATSFPTRAWLWLLQHRVLQRVSMDRWISHKTAASFLRSAQRRSSSRCCGGRQTTQRRLTSRLPLLLGLTLRCTDGV